MTEPEADLLITVTKRQASEELVRRLAEAGATGIRLIAKGYRTAEYRRHYDALHAAGNAVHDGFRVIVDLPGGKPRISASSDDFDVERGERLMFQQDTDLHAASVDARVVGTVGLMPFLLDIHPGERVLVSDGSIETRVLSVDSNGVMVEVVSPSGRITASRSINLPDAVGVHYSSRGDDDGMLLGFSRDDPLEVAVSMVGSPANVQRVRTLLPQAHVIAKIESQRGLDNIEAIAVEADELMIARADLAIEVPLQRLGYATREIADAARRAGRPVIVASSFLETLERNERPTVAEVSDLWHQHVSGVRRYLLSGTVSITNPIEATRWTRMLLDEFAQIAPQQSADRTPQP